jgi:hypothetical protein
VGVPLIAEWNPWRSATLSVFPHENWFVSRLTLLYRNFRDINRCEFCVLPVVALTPLLYLRHHCDWLLRAPLALAVYVATVSTISPQPVSLSRTADIRYLAGMIPLGIAIGVLALSVVSRKDVLLAASLGLLAFVTNMFCLDPVLHGGFRSTVFEYIGELLHPPGDPYTVAATWINAHVGPGQSICVIPDYMTYPLMFHAPQAVYAWQLKQTADKQFARLDRIHFWGEVLPDYFLAFGPRGEAVKQMLASSPVPYEQIETLDTFWKEMHRPELFWRTFRPVVGYDKSREAVYVFRKSDVPPASLQEFLS